MVSFCIQVANSIGGNITPDRVEKIIRLSNQGGHIFHGVKDVRDIDKYQKDGVLLAPSPGWNRKSSFWTSGRRLFGSTRPNGELVTYDSTFFHYGHSGNYTGRDPEFYYMTMVISNAAAVDFDSWRIKLEPDDYLELDIPLQRDQVFLIVIKMKKMSDILPRELGQMIEQELVSEIEKSLECGYSLGGMKFVEF